MIPTGPDPSGTGAARILERGYRSYDGPRLGARGAMRSLVRHSVQRVLGPRPVMTGFYSYGEISPFRPTAHCELHNQTLTVTTLGES